MLKSSKETYGVINRKTKKEKLESTERKRKLAEDDISLGEKLLEIVT